MRADFGKGVWLHNLQPFHNEEKIKQLVDSVLEAGFELLIPCVKNPDGYLDYHSGVGNVRPCFRAWDPLEALSREAVRQGLKVHPWFCVFVESLEGNGSALLQRQPDVRGIIRGEQGERPAGWLCTGRKEARDYVVSLCEEVIQNYPVQGVHLDYIRHGGLNFPLGCCCEGCRRKFEELTGRRSMELVHGQRGPDYAALTRWRADTVTDVVRRVYRAASTRALEVSAAVFCNFPIAFFDQGQDWVAWAREGIVDYLFPMSYISLPEAVSYFTRTHVALVEGRCPIWEGLFFNWRFTGVDWFMEQVENARRAGAHGIVIFEYTAMIGCRELIEELKKL